MRDGDNHILVSVEVLRIELLRSVNNLRTALIAILLLDFEQLLLHNAELHRLVSEYGCEVVDSLLQLIALCREFAMLQTCQRTQTHIYDSGSLQIGQAETLREGSLCLIHALGVANDANNLVDIILCNEQTENNVHTLLGLAQIVAATAYHNLVAMIYEVADKVEQV